MTGISALLQDAKLDEAAAQLAARLRTAPADTASRSTLAELLCLSGAFERAEAQYATLAQQTTDRPVAIARLRHLIRAAVAREGWFNEAAVPSLLREPTAPQRLAIALQVALREDAAHEAGPLLAEAEARRTKPTGTADGVPFDDFRDADDRCAWFFEVMSNDGSYIWVDLADIESLRFAPAARPIDLLWRETKLTFRNGATADVAVPAQYVDRAASPEHRLAQRTDWRDGPGGAAFGTGQRMFLVGDEARGVLELTEIVFDKAAAP